MNNAMKKMMALLLALVMVLLASPFAVLAEGELIEENLTQVETPASQQITNVSNAVFTVDLLAEEDNGVAMVEESTVATRAADQEAGIYYLKSPTGRPNANISSEFGDEIRLATVNMTGANWVDSTDWWGEEDQNVFDNLGTHIISMADGMERQKNGSWLMPKEKYSTHYQAIFNTYRSELQNDLGITLNSWEDIEAIYLVPHKISRYNGNGSTTSYDGDRRIHVDCTISVKTEDFYQAKFFVTKPGEGEVEEQVDAANYKASDPVQKTTNAPTADSGSYPQQLTVDGVTYEFDGWYNEAGEKVADSEWAYTPDEAELSDGTVNFYAYYTPMTATVTVTKTVSSEVTADSDKVFTFNYTVNGEAGESFTLKNGESKDLTVSIGAAFVVTETTDNAFATTYSVDNGESVEGNAATISSVGGSGHTIAFTNTRKLISITAAKAWVDQENAHETRPASVTLKLMNSREEVATAVVSADTNWSCTWNNLPEFDSNSNKINYTVEETAVTGYAMTAAGDANNNYTVTNTLETVNITATKTWVGDTDESGVVLDLRPESITLYLRNGEVTIGTQTVSADATTGEWSYVWNELPKYDAQGSEINYNVAEATVPGYDGSITGSVAEGFSVTNTLKTTSVSASKVWNDDNDKFGIRPDEITLQLLADGAAVTGKTATLSDTNNWAHTWENLQKTKLVTNSETGAVTEEDIEYTVQEITVPGYTSAITGDATTGFTVTNTLNQRTLTVKKTVSGNMGDQAKEFAFTTTIADEANTANLAHDGTVEYTVPYGAAVVVTENPDGYTYSLTSVTYKDAENKDVNVEVTEGTNSVSFTMPDADVTVIINNDKTADVDTGILLDSLPYVVILGVVGAALVLWFVRKRRVDD